MSDHFKFLRPIVCDGRPCGADEVVPADEIPAGTLETCLRMGHCVPCDPQGADLTTDAPTPDLTTDAPPKAPKPKRK